MQYFFSILLTLLFFYTCQSQDNDTLLQQIEAHYQAGKTAFLDDDYANALALWKQELALKNKIYLEQDLAVSKTYLNIASTYYQLDLSKNAKLNYEKALEIRLYHLKKQPDNVDLIKKIIRPFKALIKIEEELGDYDKAIQHYNNCLSFLDITPADIPDLLVYKAQALQEKGGSFIDEAIKDFQYAITVYENALQQENDAVERIGLSENVGITYSDLGNAFHLKKDYKNAHQAYLKAYDILYNDVGELSEDLFKAAQNLGASYIVIQNYDKAYTHLKEAIGFARGLFDTKKYFYKFSSPYNNLGDLYIVKNENLKALAYYDTALIHLIDNFDQIKTQLDKQQVSSQLFNGLKTNTLIVLASRASCLEKLGQKDQALKTYFFIDKVIGVLRKDLSTESSKLHWIQETRKMYEAAARIAIELQQPEKAFEFMEKSKSVLLFENLVRAEQLKLANLSEADVTKRDGLLENIQLIENEINRIDNDTTNRIRLLKNEVQNLRKQLTAFEATRFRHQAFDIDFRENALSEFQNYLKSQQSVAIEFFGSNEELLAAVITPESINFHIYDNPEHNDKIQTWAKSIVVPFVTIKDFEEANQLAYEIYQDLLLPLHIPAQQKLLIIPDGILQTIPFEALVTENPKGKSVNQLPYLLFRNPICYAYSAGVQLQLLHKKQTGINKVLAMAPREFEGLGSLKSKEIPDIQKLFSVHLLEDKQATSKAFLNKAADYNLIHLSTHASYTSDAQPWIAFRDRKLALSELYNLNLNAQLVTLSACETAQGELVKGEGVLSLARGFSFAGVPQVITALWSVNESSTAKLMSSFYTFLDAGNTPGEALLLAKKDYLRSGKQTGGELSPYYWAAFTALGHDSFQATDNIKCTNCWCWLWWLLLLVTIGSLYYFHKRKYK